MTCGAPEGLVDGRLNPEGEQAAVGFCLAGQGVLYLACRHPASLHEGLGPDQLHALGLGVFVRLRDDLRELLDSLAEPFLISGLVSAGCCRCCLSNAPYLDDQPPLSLRSLPPLHCPLHLRRYSFYHHCHLHLHLGRHRHRHCCRRESHSHLGATLLCLLLCLRPRPRFNPCLFNCLCLLLCLVSGQNAVGPWGWHSLALNERKYQQARSGWSGHAWLGSSQVGSGRLGVEQI